MAISGGLLTHGKAKESRICAVVTRADGRVEDLGTIAYWHKNPVKRWVWAIARWASPAASPAVINK